MKNRIPENKNRKCNIEIDLDIINFMADEMSYDFTKIVSELLIIAKYEILKCVRDEFRGDQNE